MRGFQIEEYAHPTKQTVSTNVPEPKPEDNDLIVDVFAAAVNFFDILQAQGKYQVQPPLPFVLGVEFAGKIAKDSPIPKGCTLKPGDRVFGAGQGAYADKMRIEWTEVLPLPENLTYEQGAGLYLTWPTSYEALTGRANLKPGEWLLVTAAAGGVGIVAVQLGKVLGAKVIAAASSAEKMDIAKRYGADYVVDYSKPGWQKEVSKITNGKGVDVIFDPVGMIKDCLKCIAWKGRALVIGFAGGSIEQLPMNLVLLKNVSVVGLHWGAYRYQEPSHRPIVWKNVLDLLSSGRVKPTMFSQIYPLERVIDALATLEQRKTWGKVIIQVKKEDTNQKAKL